MFHNMHLNLSLSQEQMLNMRVRVVCFNTTEGPEVHLLFKVLILMSVWPQFQLPAVFLRLKEKSFFILRQVMLLLIQVAVIAPVGCFQDQGSCNIGKLKVVVGKRSCFGNICRRRNLHIWSSMFTPVVVTPCGVLPSLLPHQLTISASHFHHDKQTLPVHLVRLQKLAQAPLQPRSPRHLHPNNRAMCHRHIASCHLLQVTIFTSQLHQGTRTIAQIQVLGQVIMFHQLLAYCPELLPPNIQSLFTCLLALLSLIQILTSVPVGNLSSVLAYIGEEDLIVRKQKLLFVTFQKV